MVAVEPASLTRLPRRESSDRNPGDRDDAARMSGDGCVETGNCQRKAKPQTNIDGAAAVIDDGKELLQKGLAGGFVMRARTRSQDLDLLAPDGPGYSVSSRRFLKDAVVPQVLTSAWKRAS